MITFVNSKGFHFFSGMRSFKEFIHVRYLLTLIQPIRINIWTEKALDVVARGFSRDMCSSTRKLYAKWCNPVDYDWRNHSFSSEMWQEKLLRCPELKKNRLLSGNCYIAKRVFREIIIFLLKSVRKPNKPESTLDFLLSGSWLYTCNHLKTSL